MTLTELAIRRPTIIVVLFSVLGFLGIFGFSQLQYELLPKMSPPVITITTVYPGASPSEVETSITKVIEDAVSGMDKVSVIRSTSQEGRSFVIIELLQTANVNLAIEDAQRKVNQVTLLLPKDARQPILSKIALDEIPVLRYGLTSNMEPRDFYQYVKDFVQPRISRIPGVGQISLIGGEEREILINLDVEKLKAFNLSVSGVTQLIKASNLDFPTGNIKDVDGQYVVRLAGKFTSLEEIRGIIVGMSRQGGAIRLSDVAEVQNGAKEATNINRVNLQSSIGMLVLKQSDANAVEVAKLVRDEIAKVEAEEKSKGLTFTLSQDSSLFTIDAANAVKFDLVLAVIIVAIVMLFFLHSLRNSLIVMVSIPVSIITTFGMMYLFGFTLNLMTMLGLSLVIGILVDDSIVVLENIYRHIEMGENRWKAALTGRNEIGFAALSITLVDVVVFLPIAMVSGIVGNILREFSLVVVTSTLISLLVSFTITPALAARFAKIEHITNKTLWGAIILQFERFQDWLTEQYKIILRWSLNHRKTVFAATLVLFFGSFALVGFGFIGGEFFAQTDRGEFAVQLELEPGASIQKTNEKTLELEKIIKSMPEVDKIFTTVGASSEGFIGVYSNNSSEINVTLLPKKQRVLTTDEVSLAIKEQAMKIAGMKVKVSPIGIFGAANQTSIQVIVNGTNNDNVLKYATILEDSLKVIKGATDVKLSSESGKPETRILIDRQKLAAYGLNIYDVGNTLQIALSGDDNSKYRIGNNEYTIRVQLDDYDRNKTDKLATMSFVNPMGQKIELSQFAVIERTSGPTKLQRENRNAAIIINAQNMGRPDGDIVLEFIAKVEKMQKAKTLPEDIKITYGGNYKNQQDSNSSLGIALLAAILFVYLIMVALYDSYLYPFIVLFSIPVAMIGALLALALTMKTLNIMSILGIIMLIGLVAKNAILLVDRTNQMRKEKNMSIFDALMEAGETRLRPIIMTTLAMVLGMLPIALSTASGAEWKTGLAWALIGGLTSSLLLTLVLVPSVYLTLENIKAKLSRFFNKEGKDSKAEMEAALGKAE